LHSLLTIHTAGLSLIKVPTSLLYDIFSSWRSLPSLLPMEIGYKGDFFLGSKSINPNSLGLWISNTTHRVCLQSDFRPSLIFKNPIYIFRTFKVLKVFDLLSSWMLYFLCSYVYWHGGLWWWGVGIMAAGAMDAVRGARSSTEELIHILTHSDRFALLILFT
jgi:hypothetical protein